MIEDALKLPLPVLEKLYYIEVTCSPPVPVGDIGAGSLNVIPISGGRFEGPRMRGEVLSIGAGWNTIQPNLIGKVDTRYVLKADDGALIALCTEGVAQIPVDLYLKLQAGEFVDPARYYFRQHLFFHASAEKYAWLNAIVAFGVVGIKPTGEICYDAYMVK